MQKSSGFDAEILVATLRVAVERHRLAVLADGDGFPVAERATYAVGPALRDEPRFRLRFRAEHLSGLEYRDAVAV